jgi:hypothetical protein
MAIDKNREFPYICPVLLPRNAPCALPSPKGNYLHSFSSERFLNNLTSLAQHDLFITAISNSIELPPITTQKSCQNLFCHVFFCNHFPLDGLLQSSQHKLCTVRLGKHSRCCLSSSTFLRSDIMRGAIAACNRISMDNS